MEEIWKDIPGYEGLYQVSSFGNVKSFKRGKEKIMRLSLTNGYLRVRLCKENQKNMFSSHVLVAMAFHGHIPDGFNIVVDHDDNNPLNNRADNIKLITQRENASKDKKNKTSQYVGVSWNERDGNWVTRIRFGKRYIHLGYFETEIDASNAYQKAFSEWEQGLDLNVLYPKKINSSQYKYVYWNKNKCKWIAEYKGKYLGHFDTEIEAHKAVQKYILTL